MYGFIHKSFANKIMTAVIVIVSLVMGAEILVRIYFGTRDRMALLEIMSMDLGASVSAGIKYPMSVGDSKSIRIFLADLRTKTQDVEVFICDFEQLIIWSTHSEKENTKITDSIFNQDSLTALTEMLGSGKAPSRSFIDEHHGRRNLITVEPILNDKECYHCHGASRKIVGGMVIRANVEQSLAMVVAARNRTIYVTILGIAAIITLIYMMVARFIRRPLENLATQAKKFAEGDMSVSIEVLSEDEIGILSNTFNYMVKSIARFSQELRQEVTDKTSLLNERATLIDLLKRANIQLRELDRTKSKFLANMSHELRTPMNSIIGYSELLLDGVDGPVNHEQRNSLERITNNARHLLNLINDILDLSKIESGKSELDINEFNILELVQSVFPVFEAMAAKKGLYLTWSAEENLPPVFGDDDKIRHVLMNLIANAIKFTDAGGIIVRLRMSDRGVKPGEAPIFVEVCVEDTGIGIMKEDLNRIFNKFVQADLSTTRQYEGTGLGLSIARGLVALHKGMIWATSEQGKGSQFHFTLPIDKMILLKPGVSHIDLAIAHGLAERFGQPVDTFLKKPEYAGQTTRCWQYIHCGETCCPAYDSKETRCWLILGTHCEGMSIAAYPEKVDFCQNCGVVQQLVLSAPVHSGGESVASHTASGGGLS